MLQRTVTTVKTTATIILIRNHLETKVEKGGYFILQGNWIVSYKCVYIAYVNSTNFLHPTKKLSE